MSEAELIIRRELRRLYRKSNGETGPGLGLTYDDVKMLEILIRSGVLLAEHPEIPETKQEDDDITDDDLLKSLRMP